MRPSCRSHAPDSPVSLLTQNVRSRKRFSSTSDRSCDSSKAYPAGGSVAPVARPVCFGTVTIRRTSGVPDAVTELSRASVFAVVTNEMFMPRALSTFM